MNRVCVLLVTSLVILLIFFVIIGGSGVAFVAWIVKHTSPGDQTEVLPDEPEHPVPQPIFDAELDRFRSEWDIFDRFENWPFVVPLAYMSESIYGDRLRVETCFERFGFSNIHIVDSVFHTQVVCLAKRDNVGIIVFRGTDDTEDWFSNASMYLHPTPIGGIHTGFSGAYSMLRAEILAFAKDKSIEHFWISGHSLGGAMALTCAVDLINYQHRPVRGVVTFGQPSIGKQEFMQYLDANISDHYVRFANEQDIVPRMPPLWQHSGCLFHFQNGKIRKSERYRAMTVSEGPFGSTDSYEPVTELAPPTRNDVIQFEKEYNGNKTQTVPSMSEPSGDDLFGNTPDGGSKQGLQAKLPGDDAAHVQAISYVDDHSMTLYRQKVEEATKKWQGKSLSEP